MKLAINVFALFFFYTFIVLTAFSSAATETQNMQTTAISASTFASRFTQWEQDVMAGRGESRDCSEVSDVLQSKNKPLETGCRRGGKGKVFKVRDITMPPLPSCDGSGFSFWMISAGLAGSNFHPGYGAALGGSRGDSHAVTWWEF